MLTGLHRRCALLAWTCAFAVASAEEPVEYGDPFLDSEAVIVPAGAETDSAARSSVQTADSSGAPWEQPPAGPDYLFPEGQPPADPEALYPDGTVPIQYPLDDRAYRGLPDAYPGNSDGWTPPSTSTLPSVSQPPTAAIGWKSVKASLTEVFGTSDSLGITSFDVRGTLEFGRLPGVFVTPQFGWHFLAGPSATDLPPQLYDLSVDLSLYRPVGDQWLFNLALTPSLFTDGENLSGDAIRVMGRAMAYYTASPTLQWAGGIVYLDRTDLPVLPAIGVICTPREDIRFELMFPRPRLAWRQWFNGVEEQWVYVTGELGGQSWGVVRASGADDIATYRDLRLVLGLERKQSAGQSWFVEGGYVFGREVEYESNIGGADLSATGFLRVGGAF
ncbi:MAG: hypothetical protein JNG89_04895 [Planctomycetaceae bacterium]|nr:hypothetical protein [Planctomycetaceae bacterium]